MSAIDVEDAYYKAVKVVFDNWTALQVRLALFIWVLLDPI
jgi:hypothetical protein